MVQDLAWPGSELAEAPPLQVRVLSVLREPPLQYTNFTNTTKAR